MAEPTIICPKCKNEIKLTESLAAPLVESTRRELEQRLAQKDLDVAAREKSIRDREEALSRAKETLESQVNERLQQDRAKIAAEEARKAKLALTADLIEKAKEVTELQEILKQKDVKLTEAQNAQASLLKKERELQDARRELELSIEKRVGESLEASRQQARKEAAEQYRLELSEKEGALAAVREQAGDMAKREQALKQREASLVSEKSKLEEEVTRKLERERVQIVAEEARKAKLLLGDDLARQTRELAALQEALRHREGKLAEAQEAQAGLMKKQRELEEAKREVELSVQRRVQEEIGSAREKARKEAEEESGLRVKEKELQIASMQSTIEDLKRKAEQGSQQLQGEVQELHLETLLRAKFPHDTIEPVPKGEFGGDTLHRVITPLGQVCGTILWESKRTKNWSDGWLAKLRDDQRSAKAEIAIIISQVLPKGVETFGQVDGIWIAQPQCAISVAVALRFALIETATARLASEGQQTKMEMVYQYLTSPRFRQRVQAIVEAFSSMKEDLDKEKKAITRQWAKREEQIDRVMHATVGMYGDLQGIAGKTIQEIEGLEMKMLEDPATDAGQR